jgi:hypothetical protein
VLLGCAVAFTLLTLSLLAIHDSGSHLAQAIGSDRNWMSLVLYIVALGWRACSAGLDRDLRRSRSSGSPDRRVERVVGSA